MVILNMFDSQDVHCMVSPTKSETRYGQGKSIHHITRPPRRLTGAIGILLSPKQDDFWNFADQRFLEAKEEASSQCIRHVHTEPSGFWPVGKPA